MSISRMGGMALIAGIWLFAGPAGAAGCTLVEVELQCGKQDKDVFSALSSEESAKVFESPELSLEAFTKPSDLEAFRRSLEKNWKAINRVERRERLKLRRRQISASEFETWSKNYDTALSNYRLGLNFYRTLVWYGKTGKPAPVDDVD